MANKHLEQNVSKLHVLSVQIFSEYALYCEVGVVLMFISY